jgi:hypothetical protein
MVTYVQKCVKIRDDQFRWLAANPKVNASGLMQMAIDEEMARNERPKRRPPKALKSTKTDQGEALRGLKLGDKF